MPKKFTYAEAGVDRKLRAKSKKGFTDFQKTYRFSRYGEPIQLPYNTIYPLGGERYQDHIIEGVGTKVLLAQLGERYDTIGIDAVAMAVNDVIRSGARPISITDNIDAQRSDPYLVNEWKRGIIEGAVQAEAIVPGGETADVFDLMKNAPRRKGRGFHMEVSCVGELYKREIIWGKNLKVGDRIIGLRSSGVHSNGISMIRRVLFKAWDGKYKPFDIPDGFDREIVYEVLEPTKIYVKPVLKVRDEHKIKAAIHITGDAYLKFDKLTPFNKGIGFEFYNFKPQPIFELIQKTAPEVRGVITDDEMLKTFNMGWGFAVIVEEEKKDDVLDTLEKEKTEAEEIGKVTDSGKIIANYKDKKIQL